MNWFAKDDYLTTEVLTAAPQKLQLMLLDAAIRLANKTREHWRQGQEEQAGEALIRCQQIMAELMSGLKPDQNQELVGRVRAIYLFVYRSLVLAHLQHSDAKLVEAISVLEVERETWRQVCVQLGSHRHAEFQGHQPSERTSFVA